MTSKKKQTKPQISSETYALHDRVMTLVREYREHFNILDKNNHSLVNLLDELGNDLRSALADFKRALREEALQAFEQFKVTSLTLGTFSSVVPIGRAVDLKAFWRRIWERPDGELLAQQAIDQEVLEQTITLPKDGAARLENWAAKNGLLEELKGCQSETPQTPRISAADKANHPIPPLGQHYSEK